MIVIIYCHTWEKKLHREKKSVLLLSRHVNTRKDYQDVRLRPFGVVLSIPLRSYVDRPTRRFDEPRVLCIRSPIVVAAILRSHTSEARSHLLVRSRCIEETLRSRHEMMNRLFLCDCAPYYDNSCEHSFI